MARRSWLMALALAAGACSNPQAAEEIVPLQIEKVDVLVLESFPVQVEAVVRGTLPSPCSSLDSVTQSRQGNTVEVTITTRTDREQLCILVVQPVTERVRLEGSFPPGEYLLRVNGTEVRFRV